MVQSFDTAALRRGVLVIGAGPAGAMCARVLAERGFDVAVVDKGARPGGRTSTRDMGEAHFDHGAQYLTIRSPLLEERLAGWRRRGVLEEWRGPFIHVVDRVIEDHAPSARRFVGTPGMNSLTAHLLEGIETKFGKRVVDIESHHTHVEVSFDDGERMKCGHVVVAVPAPQATALLHSSPALRSSLDNVEIAPCWAAMLEFADSLELDWSAAKVEGDSVAWIARNQTKPGRPPKEAWVVHASAAWSRDMLEASPQDVGEELASSARGLFGIAAQPAAIRTHRWRFGLVEKPVGAPCLFDGRLAVCGDALLGARIENALLSGLATAERLVTRLEIKAQASYSNPTP